MNKSISLLIGAGFSAPMGYPVGNQLNEEMLKLTHNDFGVDSVEFLHRKENFQEGNREPNDLIYRFCVDLIKHFEKRTKYFDYEEFYDYLKEEASIDRAIEKMVEQYRSFFDKDTLISKLPSIYNQLVALLIKDSSSRSHYEDASFSQSIPTHMGILKCMRELSEQGIVNVHTLNHDLLFERFRKTSVLSGKISDGFEEIGSPYYATCILPNNTDVYNVRLASYTGKYDTPVRLYKLHGSLDYYAYPTKVSTTVHSLDCYVKLRAETDRYAIKKELRSDDGKRFYEELPSSYHHPDFLTGTTAKILRYDEPLLYKQLFERFQENLQQAEKLIIIGYGGGDEKVNDIIMEHFDYRNKPCFIIDPYAGEGIRKFSEKLGATLLPPEKTVETITTQDLQF